MKAVKFGLLTLLIIAFLACGAQKAPIKTENQALNLEVGAAGKTGMLSTVDQSKGYRIDDIRVYLSGYICPDCIAPLKTTLEMEGNVKIVSEHPDTGMIEIVPQNGQFVDLRDLEERINGTREGTTGFQEPEVTVRDMEIVAVGRVEKFTQEYHSNTEQYHLHDWYRLIISENPDYYFILSEGPKLDELKTAGYQEIVTVGTVSSYYIDTVPILHMKDFIKLEKP